MTQPECNAHEQDCVEESILARLQASPGNTRVLLELQSYYKQHARHEEESAILRHLLDVDLVADERAEALHDLVYALYRQGNLAEAISRAETLLGAYPDYRYLSSVLWLLGVMYADLANRPELAVNWRQYVAMAERNLTSALQYVDDRDERASILVELGAAQSSSGKLIEARSTFERALDNGIEEPRTLTLCYQQLGRVFYRLDQDEQAKRCYEQAVLVAPRQPSNARALAYIDLAALSRQEGDIDEAERCCQLARQVLDASNSVAESVVLEALHEELGNISYEKGEYQLAIDHYETAMQRANLPEKQDELYYKLSAVLQWNGQYERALEVLRQALALQLSSPSPDQERVGEILLHMGQYAYVLGDNQRAAIVLEKAAEKVPLSMLIDVHLTLGRSYFSLRRFDTAAKSYKQVIRNARILSPEWKEAVKYLVLTRVVR